MLTTTCPTCQVESDPDTGRIAHKVTTRIPDIAQLEEWMSDGECEATDGCLVEPDGTCEHGHRSWLLRLSMI